MPNPTHTPPRSVRVDGRLWRAARLKAHDEGRTVTDVITEALRRYVLTPTGGVDSTPAPDVSKKGA